MQVLALGFLLVILSCALYKAYHPLIVVATFVLAPLPNWICGRCSNPDDFVDSSAGGGSAIIDFGRFCTGFLVTMGIGECLFLLRDCHYMTLFSQLRLCFAFIRYCLLTIPVLPVILAHSHLITFTAMIMSIVGGVLIYGTIISFGLFFEEEQEF